jgi:hypothetical protein
VKLRTNSGSQVGLVAVYVRTVKTASGGTAVQAVHPAHYPGPSTTPLTASTGTQVRTKTSSMTEVTAVVIRQAFVLQRQLGAQACAGPASRY